MAGTKKCGTSAFKEFIKHHSKIVISQENEPHFFDYYFHKGVKNYVEKFVGGDDLSKSLFEKSPNYLWEPIERGNVRGQISVPEKILTTYEDFCGSKNCQDKLKIAIIICNPSLRAYSDYVHDLSVHNLPGDEKSSKKSFLEMQEDIKSFGNFNDFVEISTGTLNQHFKKYLDEKSFGPITRGLYALQIKEWLNYFPLSQFIFIDGDELITNPGKVMVQFQKDMKLEIEITENDFTKNSKFLCWLPVIS